MRCPIFPQLPPAHLVLPIERKPDAIARKRSSLKNMSQPDALPDFSPAPPAHLILPIERKPFASAPWKSEVIRLSALFDGYPKILSSGVEMLSSQSMNYIVTSEGTELRTPEDLAYIRVAGRGLTTDGTRCETRSFSRLSTRMVCRPKTC